MSNLTSFFALAPWLDVLNNLGGNIGESDNGESDNGLGLDDGSNRDWKAGPELNALVDSSADYTQVATVAKFLLRVMNMVVPARATLHRYKQSGLRGPLHATERGEVKD
jgi:hypothetical protein